MYHDNHAFDANYLIAQALNARRHSASQLLPQLFSRSAADGETILMAAALHARLDLVHLFLDIGAFPWTETLGRHSPPKNAIAFAMVAICAIFTCSLDPSPLVQMNPNAAIPGSPSAQIAALLQSQMPTFDSKGCVVDRTVLCKHPHESLAIDPEEGDLCCTACSLVMSVVSALQCAPTFRFCNIFSGKEEW